MFRLTERASRWVHRLILPSCAAVVSLLAARSLVEECALINGLLITLERPSVTQVDKDLLLIETTKDTKRRLGLDPRFDRLPRDVYGRLAQGLDVAGANGVVFDIVFADEYEGTEAFGRALRALRPDGLRVTLVTAYGEEEDGIKPPTQTEEGVLGEFLPSVVYEPTAMPNVALSSAFSLQGRENRVVKGAIAVQRSRREGKAMLHAAFQAAIQKYRVVQAPRWNPGSRLLQAGPLAWRLDENQALEVAWPRDLRELPKLEMAEALKELDDPVRRRRFAGKTVVVGGGVGMGDKVRTVPFGEIPGVEFVACMVNTAIESEVSRPREAWPPLVYGSSGLMASLAFAFGFCRRAGVALLGAFGLMSMAWTLPDILASAGIEFPRLAPSLSIVLAVLLGLVASISPLFREDHRHAGAIEEVTVLFLDVRGSTRLLDQEGVETYRTIVEHLLVAGNEIVRRHGGTVERTLGDGLIAIFRSGRSGHPALCAAQCATELVGLAGKVGQKHGCDLAAGIGLETGMVTGGYVSEAGRRTWSSAGKTVNLAQRLQAASESLGAMVVVGPVAASLIEHRFPLRPLGVVRVKGFERLVSVATFGKEED